jgi:hypothetical protein
MSPERVDYEEYPFKLPPSIQSIVQGPNDIKTGELWQGEDNSSNSPGSYWGPFFVADDTDARELDPSHPINRKRSRESDDSNDGDDENDEVRHHKKRLL